LLLVRRGFGEIAHNQVEVLDPCSEHETAVPCLFFVLSLVCLT